MLPPALPTCSAAGASNLKGSTVTKANGCLLSRTSRPVSSSTRFNPFDFPGMIYPFARFDNNSRFRQLLTSSLNISAEVDSPKTSINVNGNVSLAQTGSAVIAINSTITGTLSSDCTVALTTRLTLLFRRPHHQRWCLLNLGEVLFKRFSLLKRTNAECDRPLRGERNPDHHSSSGRNRVRQGERLVVRTLRG